jgi:hypothetical protein
MKMSSATECPKCHYLRTETDTAPDWQCPQCGIAYAKFTQPANSPEPEAKKNTQQKLPLKTISDISWGITFSLLFIKYLIARVHIGDVAMAIVVYISTVPVLSVLFGDGLYMWNRNAMRFEPYQNDNPWVVKFIFSVCFLLLIAMTGLFFLTPTRH